MNHESHLKIHQSMWIQWPFLQKLEQKVIDPLMTVDPTSVEVTCVTLPKDQCPSPMGIHQCMWIQWSILQITKGHWPLDNLWPHICWCLMCDSTQGSLCPSPMKIHQCGYSDPFCKNLNQRSLTPKWPLTPHLLRSHVWLYPRIIVSKSHGNTSMYVDTVINFANYHIHTHTTYYIQNQWSHSLFLNYVQARQKRQYMQKEIVSQAWIHTHTHTHPIWWYNNSLHVWWQNGVKDRFPLLTSFHVNLVCYRGSLKDLYSDNFDFFATRKCKSD